MASPFRFFRKYTGLMMAFLCALLMLAFVVADPLMQAANSGRQEGNSNVAVSWDGGKLTEGQLGSLVEQRQMLAAFQREVLLQGYLAAEKDGVVDPRPLVQPLDLPARFEENVEQNVVLTKIYADAARKAGFVVGDDTIRTYLRDLGFQKVSSEDMRGILRSMQGGPGDDRFHLQFASRRHAGSQLSQQLSLRL